MFGTEIERLVQLLSRLPGLGPRSGRRAALALLKRKEALLLPLMEQLRRVAESVRVCSVCGNLDTTETCAICRDPGRDSATLCVVEDVADLWAIERSGAFRGHYHVLGGALSALDGVGPDELSVGALVARVKAGGICETILALNATVDGQTTAHYLSERLQGLGISVSRLAHGVPIGGELDYLDDGTLATALKARRPAL